MGAIHRAAGVLAILSLLTNIIATFSPGWIIIDGGGDTVQNGLFYACSSSECQIRTNYGTFETVMLTLMVLAFVFMLIGSITVSVGSCNRKKCPLQAGGILISIAATLCIAAAAYYTNNINGSIFSILGDFGYAYAFTWVTAVLGIIASTVAYYSGKK